MTASDTMNEPAVPVEMSMLGRLVALPQRALRRIFQKGPIDSLKWIWFVCNERFRERQLGIHSVGSFNWDHDPNVDSDCNGTEPTSYQIMDTIIAAAGIRAGEDVLVDYGCGKARSTIVLATQPLKKAIGIEMAGQLCDIARDNVELASSKLNTPDVEILQADATKYDVPEDANIIYLYN